MDLTRVALADLKLDSRNARKHSKRNLETIGGSLAAFGQVENLVVQRGTMKVIGGNGRVEAMRAKGDTHAHVLLVDVDDTQAAKLGLALNRTAELAGWDKDNLSGIIDDLKLANIDVADVGFTDAEMADLVGITNIDVHDGDDAEVEASDGPTTTKVGDVWQLGDHRLMCGDSTCANHVNALMSGRDANLCFTSPPYAQQRDYDGTKFDWDHLMQGVFSLVPVTDDAQLFVNLGMVYDRGEWSTYWDGWVEWMRSQGWRKFGWYVWDQVGGIPGANTGRLSSQHEFIFHFNKKPGVLLKTHKCSSAGRKFGVCGIKEKDGKVAKRKYKKPVKAVSDHKIMSSVISVPRASYDGDSRGVEHPAKFPTMLPAQFLNAYLPKGGLCYDPFLGSGTSIIAAERTSSVCYGMELSPKYADVIVERWQNATGGKAVKVTHG